jgi:membrane protein required for beta-lactamase induction
MLEWLLSRATIVSLAVLGGICSALASWCVSRNMISERHAVQLNAAAYAFMAISITLFIAAGMFGSESPG